MADVTLTDGPNILLKGIDSSGFKLEEEIAISSAGDKPPSIEVVSPSGKAVCLQASVRKWSLRSRMI